MGDFKTNAIGAGDPTSMAEKAKKYKERYGEVMQGIGSFSAVIGNVWQNAQNGNINLGDVSVFENNSCATSM